MANQPATSINFQALQFIGGHNTIACTTAQVITLPTGANAALIQATGQNIRIRFDGTNPTAASGFLEWQGVAQ